jgi:uncharacterized protein (TIGR03435 family)
MILESLSLIANHLWQSTLFAGVAGLLTMALRRNSARVRHWIWVGASVKFLLPFFVLVMLGSHVQWRTVPSPVGTSFSVTFDQINQPFTARTSSPPLMTTLSASAGVLPEVLGALWACGFVGLACSWWIRWRRVVAAVIAGSAVQLSLPIRAVSSPSFLEPGVFGVFRPVLLLPEGIFERLTPGQLESVLAHELCHLRHRDNLIAMVQMFVETVFWFHPLVWWIGGRIFNERERACDEEVLRLGNDPRTYAQGILKICELYFESPVPCVSGVTGTNLRRRVAAILNNRAPTRLNPSKKLLLVCAATLATAAPFVVGLMNAPIMHAQPQGELNPPKFEVASIRPCDQSSRPGGRGGEPPAGSLRVQCATVAILIHSAYDTSANGRETTMFTTLPVTGGPAWINTDRYTINAKAEGNPARAMIMGPMLRVLLEDRFHLKIRRETREVPVYVLSIAKGGAKLKPSREGSCPTPGGPPGVSCPGSVWIARNGSNLVVDQQATMADFARMLIQRLDRPVIDKTGIAGMFDFHLEFAPDPTMGNLPPRDPQGATADAAAPPGGPSVFSAVQEQLGLKLDSAKGPGEVLVIDHVERPIEN